MQVRDVESVSRPDQRGQHSSGGVQMKEFGDIVESNGFKGAAHFGFLKAGGSQTFFLNKYFLK